ncbi:MAG: metallophosphoesterase [Phycisphaerae bacterium]|jgi:predicted MPP superfamily phosphohydrolase
MKKIYLIVIVCIFTFSAFGGQGRVTADANFYFVQITDTHLKSKENIERTEKIIKKINSLPFKVEFVVNTGDIMSDNIADGNAVKEAKKVFSKLKSPIYFVAGNHDVPNEKSKALYIKNFGQLNYSRENNNVVLIFIYANSPANDSNAFDMNFFEWFEKELNSAGNKPIIIFGHIPAGRDFYNNRFHDSWPRDVERKFTKMINAHNVEAVITGHFHRDELHWLGKVPMYVCSPVSEWLGRQAAFRIYQYENGKISYSTQYIDR